jgi:hypothetical protein
MTTNQLVDGTLYNFKGKGEFLFKDNNFKRVYLRTWISKNSEDMAEFLDLINPEFELSPEKVALLNLEEDIFENSRKEIDFPLLSDYERSLLPEIDNKILGFKNIKVHLVHLVIKHLNLVQHQKKFKKFMMKQKHQLNIKKNLKI